MESELNRQIREICELFGVDTEKVEANYTIVGHLRRMVDEAISQAREEAAREGRKDELVRLDNHMYNLPTESGGEHRLDEIGAYIDRRLAALNKEEK